jgi:hypothetical protein
MQNETPASDEIDITEAIRITGKSRETLMRWKRLGKLKSRTEEREYTQRQRRVLFRWSDVERLAGDEAQRAVQGAAVDTHALNG